MCGLSNKNSKRSHRLRGFQLSTDSTGRYLTCISRDLTCSTFQPPLGTTAKRRSHFNLNGLPRAVPAIRPARTVGSACTHWGEGGEKRKLIPLTLKCLAVPHSPHCDTRSHPPPLPGPPAARRELPEGRLPALPAPAAAPGQRRSPCPGPE